MEENFAREELLQVVENQINDNKPAVVKETLMRLSMTGQSREEALEMIACALMSEMLYIVQQEIEFSEERYAKLLKQLPDLSFLDDKL